MILFNLLLAHFFAYTHSNLELNYIYGSMQNNFAHNTSATIFTIHHGKVLTYVLTS